MRKLCLVLILLALPLAALADYQPVLFAYAIQDRISGSQNGSSQASLGAGSGLGIGLLLDGGGSDRLSLDYTDVDLRQGNGLQLLDLGYDRFLRPAGLPAPLGLFAGASVGLGRLAPAGGGSELRPHAGLRAGLVWQLDARWAVELGARYLYTGLAADSQDSAGQPGTLHVDAVSSGWLGVHYRLQ